MLEVDVQFSLLYQNLSCLAGWSHSEIVWWTPGGKEGGKREEEGKMRSEGNHAVEVW